MSPYADLNNRLGALLTLTSAPVAVTFRETAPSGDVDPVAPAPAGCCFWAPAREQRLDTIPADHANCSVGSYTHGLLPLAEAAAGADTAALLASGWVGEADLVGAPVLPFAPASITYEPLAEATSPDVVLLRLTASAVMTLAGAIPELKLVPKPQCVIVPLAYSGEVAVSPGCAVSRTRTSLPDDEMTCAVPAANLHSFIDRLTASSVADRAVSEFAAADMAANFSG
ncbi:DUF169 domain-containing protein [Nocardioides sp. WS12]|uniref:DUF169 domain-containing protein n=1 Tax=Nocardioides sp. WS12 TaxID=2486272 RepID=UPI0015FC946C|nr:DUF169 domain-containing protein [Nocardioides sp. WS12]